MAGHSKWANIKHRKAAQDNKRGKVFTKIAKEVTVAAKIGGGDPEGNARLRTALVKARSVNMPKDNIDRAIKKGTGDLEGIEYTEKTYEGYGPAGVAFLVECLTDNVNRTVSEVRHAFSRAGGNLGTDGSVAWQFQQKGIVVFDRSLIPNKEKLFDLAIEHGAEDVKEEEGVIIVECAYTDFETLRQGLEAIGVEPEAAELTRIADNPMSVDNEQSESIQRLADVLEDNDDIQNVYHNAELVN